MRACADRYALGLPADVLAIGENGGRAERPRDTCIVGIAVLISNAVDALEFVPMRQRRPRAGWRARSGADLVVIVADDESTGHACIHWRNDGEVVSSA
jgi:hypothetical protein